MSITTSLSSPFNLLKSIYSGGQIEICDDIFISFNKNILYLSMLPDLHEVRQLVISETQEDFMTALAVDEDNRQIYAFTKSAKCYIVDIDTLTVVSQFQTPHTQLLNNALYIPDLKSFISTSLDHTLKLFNENNSLVKSFKLDDLVLELKLINDNIVVIIMKSQTMLLDLNTQIMMQLQSAIATSCVYLSEQQLLLIASKDKVLALYECKQIDTVQKVASTYIIDTLYSMKQIDNRYVACVSGKGNIVIIDVTKIGQKASEYDDLTYKYYFTGIHPQDHFAMKKAQEIGGIDRKQPHIYDFVNQLEQPVNQFINLSIYRVADENNTRDKIVVTDVQNTIFMFQFTDPLFIEREVQLQLTNAVHGEYGEILSIQTYTVDGDVLQHQQLQYQEGQQETESNQITNQNSIDYILFSSSSNLLNIYNLRGQKMQLLFGHQDPIQHIRICGDLLFTASQRVILCHQIDAVNYNVETDDGCLLPQMLLQINLSEENYVSAFDVYVGPSRAFLAYAKDRKIHLIELTKLLNLAKRQLSENSVTSTINAADVEQFVTAHLDVINSVKINANYQQIISGSVDKSVALWSYDKQLSKRQEQPKLTVFDIFTNKVNSKFSFGVDKTNNYLYLVKQLHSDFKRVVWDIQVSQSGNFFLAASGDKKVRLYKITNKSNNFNVQCVKTFTNFLAPVVQATFLNPHQIVTLEQSSVLQLININTSEVQAIVDIGIIMKRDNSSLWMRKKLLQLKSETNNKQDQNMITDDTYCDFSTSAMKVVNENQIYVGSSAGQLYFIYDNSVEVEQEKQQQLQIKLQNQLTFQQYMDAQQYNQALLLSLKLNDENQALKLFQTIINRSHDCSINIDGFSLEEVEWCLKQSLNWLKFNKKYQYGLTLLFIVLKYTGVKVLLDAGYKQMLDEIKQLLVKHQERLTTTKSEAMLLEWL